MTKGATSEERSRQMRKIRSKNTKPETMVRKLCRTIGYPGYRLHRNDIPGSPDICYIGRRKVIFVHGCFWHGHSCRSGMRRPKSNEAYWHAKISMNRSRDVRNLDLLIANGWGVLVIWECQLKHLDQVAEDLKGFLFDDCANRQD